MKPLPAKQTKVYSGFAPVAYPLAITRNVMKHNQQKPVNANLPAGILAIRAVRTIMDELKLKTYALAGRQTMRGGEEEKAHKLIKPSSKWSSILPFRALPI